MEVISINFKIPGGWQEMNDKQLRYVYSLIAKGFSADEIKLLSLIQFSGCKVIGKNENSFLLQMGKTIFQTSALQTAELLPALGWLDVLPSSPVRLKKLRRHEGVDAEFQGVPFEIYIVVENLYQGFLTTQKDALLDDLAHVLYPGCSESLTAEERISIFYWVAALKDMFAKRFSDFFQPASADAENLLGGSANIGKQLQESMDAQIRALTKGDITKEKEILAMDTWRALTELNAQAREYKQLNAQINGNK